jgi:hypothetical protein
MTDRPVSTRRATHLLPALLLAAGLAAAEPVPAAARTPAGAWAARVPAVAEYQHRIAPVHRKRLNAFLARYAAVDASDRRQFHAALLAERRTYPDHLTPQDAARYAAWIADQEAMHAEIVAARALHTAIAQAGVAAEDGHHFTLVGFDGTTPIYSFATNVRASQSTAVDKVRQVAAFDPALSTPADGSGLYVNVNDHGTIYEHSEFQLPSAGGSRILVTEVNDGGDRAHMTHVAGTVAAWGYNTSLTGMAPRAWIRSLIQMGGSDIMTYGAQYPGQLMTIANPRTSEMQKRSVMGTTSLGWDTHNDQYNSTAAYYDQILWDYPYYAHFYAASNNGGGGYATLGDGEPHAKNFFTIGSVSDVTRDASGNITGGGGVSGFSSRGPGLDGRIKPDFTANGEGLTSCSGTSGTGSMSGTSMATPNASGSTTLLIDYIAKRFPGHFLRSDTLKALLATTADDRGTVGPDYAYGWGVISIQRAATLMKRQAENAAARVVVEDLLTSGGSRAWTFTYDGSGPIRATLAWCDPPGAASTTNAPVLINDLNLRLVGAGGTTYYPWVMPYVTGNGTYPAFSSSLFTTAATTGNNTTDNVEQVAIEAPPAGTYTVQISHAGTLNGGSQRFALAVSGMARADALATAITAVTPATSDGSNGLQIAIDGSDLLFGSDIILRKAGSADVTAYGEITIPTRITARIDTAAMTPGFWDVVVRRPGGLGDLTLANAFLVPGERLQLATNGFADATGLTLASPWAVGVPAEDGSSGPNAAVEGTTILATNLSGNYTGSLNVSAVLPAFSSVGRSGLRITCQRWLMLNTGDSGVVEYSTDGSTWNTVTTHTGTFYDWIWMPATYTLPAGAENKAAVQVRFRLQTNGTNHASGWNLDDLRITANPLSSLPPVFTSTPPGTATVGQAFTYTVTTSDGDTAGSALTLAANGLPAGLSFTPNGTGGGTISGTPTVSGTAAVQVSAADGTFTTKQLFSLIVLPVGGNHPTAIITSTLPDAHVGVAYNATVSATDADGHAITLSTTGRPSWLQFTDNGNGTGTFSGTPGAGANGSASITVSASDGLQTTQAVLPLTIRPRASVALAGATASVGEGAGSLTLAVARSGNNAGAVSVAYATANGTAASGSDYTATSGTLTWADGATGSQNIAIPIIDDLATEGSQTFTLTLSGLTGIADLGIASTAVTITDNDNNVAPSVTITRPAPALAGIAGTAVGLVLEATVTDDALPLSPGTLTRQWTQTQGPGTAVFASATTANTTVTFPQTGVYVLQLAVSDGEFSGNDTVTVRVGPAPGIVAGSGILRDVWNGISGTSVANLTGNAAYPASPSSSSIITTGFEAPSAVGDNYGQRLSGWFIPPATGNYTFFIAADDNAELWLGTTSDPASAVLVCSVTGYTGVREWTKNASQQSVAIALTAGQPYWIMALHKEGTGGDNLAVRALFPDASDHAPIDNAYLAAAASAIPANYGPVPTLSAPASPTTGTPFALGGAVTDDGIPGTGITTLYQHVAGPATLAISNASSLAGTGTASVAGSYTWRLRADDGQIATVVDLTATVAGVANTAPQITTSANASAPTLVLP